MTRPISIAFALFALTAGAADVLPTTNRIDWSTCGVRGGIPNRTTIFQTFNAGATASQINSALSSCPSNQVVLLNAGTYSLTAQLKIQKDGVTLRGSTNSAGEPTTIINFTSGASGWGLIDFSKAGYPANNWGSESSRNVSSGLTQGSTTVVLASSPTGLAVGQTLWFDAVADETNAICSGVDEPPGTGMLRPTCRSYMQGVVVTNISGSTVKFEPPIRGPYWSYMTSPQAWWHGSGLSQLVARSGLEHIKVNRVSGGGGAHNIHYGPAVDCWAVNVWVSQCDVGNIRAAWVVGFEARDCFLSKHDNVGSATYGFYLSVVSNFKLENNIISNSPCAFGLLAASGGVVAYNMATNFPYSQTDWMPQCFMQHLGHCDFNLIEGNYIPTLWWDATHGNSSFSTAARNRLRAWEPGKTSSTHPINLHSNQWNIAIVGNDLGSTNYHTSTNQLWQVDSTSIPSMIRKGNYNNVEGGAVGPEALGGSTIQDSYYLSSKPSWFGNLDFPVWGASSTNHQPTAIPAGYRLFVGAWPPVDQPPPVSHVRVRPAQ